MKRLLICFFGVMLLVASLAIFVGAQSADELPVEDTRAEWQVYMEDKLWPTVASIGTSIFGIYLMVSPVLSRMNKSTGTLGGAADDFKSALKELKDANEARAKQEERMALLEAQNEAYRQAAEAAEKRFGSLCRIFAIAFGSNEEMVKSGAAREMMEVVEQYVGKEE